MHELFYFLYPVFLEENVESVNNYAATNFQYYVQQKYISPFVRIIQVVSFQDEHNKLILLLNEVFLVSPEINNEPVEAVIKICHQVILDHWN